MERSIAPFVREKEGFYKKRACVNCSINEFCACRGADLLFDIDEINKRKSVSVEEGIRITCPLKVEKGLITGRDVFVSLSHEGILAIYASDKSVVQFTDLINGRQVEIHVEDQTHVGFYDGMVLLLTQKKPLREATVKELFDKQTIEAFREIKGTNNVNPFTDISLLDARKKLYYSTMDGQFFVFDVNIRTNRKINVGVGVKTIASLTGINCGIEAVFQGYDNCIYTLNDSGMITKIRERQDNSLSMLFPSAYNPKIIRDAVFKYKEDPVKTGNNITTEKLINSNWYYSVIRVYRNIFLAYDEEKKSWFLLRIITPLLQNSNICSAGYISKSTCVLDYFYREGEKEPYMQHKLSNTMNMKS